MDVRVAMNERTLVPRTVDFQTTTIFTHTYDRCVEVRPTMNTRSG